MLLVLGLPSRMYAEQKPSLHDLFENHGSAKVQAKAGTDDVFVVDLAEWQNEYDETLTIGTGKKYKFTNGELKWIGGDAPLIVVTNGSSIEIAEGVTFIHSNSSYQAENIRMTGGTVILNGGSVNAYTSAGKPGYSISMKSENNEFLMIDGVLDGELYASSEQNNIIRIQGGQIFQQITTFADVVLEEGAADLQIEDCVFLYSKNTKVRLQCELKSNLSFGFKETGPGCVVVQGDNGYTITNSDVEKMSLYYNYLKDRYCLSLENNQVVLREKGNMTEDELQAKINAAVGNSSPEALTEISIPEEGIELTKTLYVPEGAHVNLVGGKFSLKKGHTTHTYFVSVAENATLRMDNMTWDLSYVEYSDYMFSNGGHFIFGNGMEFTHTNSCKFYSAFIMNTGTFDMYSGNISQGCLAVKGTTDQGTVNIYGGGLYGGVTNSIVNLYDGSIVGGTVTTKDFVQKGGMAETTINTYNYTIHDGYLCSLGEFYAMGGVNLYGGSFNTGGNQIHASHLYIGEVVCYNMDFAFVPDGDDHLWNRITLSAPLTFDINVNSDWENYDFTKKPVVCDVIWNIDGINGGVTDRYPLYEITQSDFDHIKFVNLPENVKAKLENQNTQIILYKKQSLSDLFNDLPEGGSEEEPNNVTPEGTDEVDVEEPSDGKPDLHLLFGDDSDDIPEGTEPKKDLHFLFDGEYGLSIHPTSSYEFKNINIDLGNHSIEHVIYVYGTLIINVNVYFINVTEYVNHVIYIRKGGRVIFRGGRHYIPGVVIYNEGGTIIYEDGESHGGTHGVVNNGGTVTIGGGTIGGNGHGIHNTGGGTVTITGGHIHGGSTAEGGTPGGNTSDSGHVIYNDETSRVNIFGGDYDDNSSVWSEGSLWIDGSVNIRDFYIRRNITVYIVNRIIINWYFYFIDFVDINCNIPLFKGDGYILTEEDLNRIHIILPDGYRLVLDKTINAIIIVSTDGIDNISMDSTAPKSIYSPTGECLSTPQKGINIIDGKKVLVK